MGFAMTTGPPSDTPVALKSLDEGTGLGVLGDPLVLASNAEPTRRPTLSSTASTRELYGEDGSTVSNGGANSDV